MFKSFLETRGGGLIESPEGFIAYTQPSAEYLRINGLYVIPEWRRCSVAQHLISQLMTEARDRKCKWIEHYVEQEYKHQTSYLIYHGFSLDEECSRWAYFIKQL